MLLAGCAAHGPYFRLKPALTSDVRTFGGAEYLPLSKFCRAYGLDCGWDDVIRTATIEKGAESIVLRCGSRMILVNGSEKTLDRPVVMDGGTVFVPMSFIRNNLAPVIGEGLRGTPAAPEITAKYTIRTVVLDPGHGGNDPGALGGRSRVKEKDMALALARKLREILQENGIKVVMTRDSDTFIPLSKRARIANNSGADLFVSLHINASRSRSLKGFECYFLSNATDDNARALEAAENASLKLGEEASAEMSGRLERTLWDMTLTEDRREAAILSGYICDSVKNDINIGNRGLRTARFYVLKFTRIPAVLVEAGYISNKYDEAKLKDPAFLGKIAKSVAAGIIRFRQEYERTEAFTR
jgi:N-acetylmuramoyl-L-alanine amidase